MCAQRLFNGKITVAELFTLKNAQQVKHLAEAVLQQPTEYGVASINVPECKKALKDVLDFDFDNSPPVFLNGQKLAPKDYVRNGIHFHAYSPLNSFIHGISFTEAPPDATRENFYLPFCAGMGKVLYTLAGKRAPKRLAIIFDDKQPGTEQPSFIVSADPSYLLGTTIPRLGMKKQDYVQRKNDVQKANWQWMRDVSKERVGSKRFDVSIVRPNPEGIGQLFGHCAETHAFVIKLL